MVERERNCVRERGKKRGRGAEIGRKKEKLSGMKE